MDRAVGMIPVERSSEGSRTSIRIVGLKDGEDEEMALLISSN